MNTSGNSAALNTSEISHQFGRILILAMLGIGISTTHRCSMVLGVRGSAEETFRLEPECLQIAITFLFRRRRNWRWRSSFA